MSGHRPFSIVLDDIIRSPSLSGEELRLYMIMLSYCTKSGDVRKCDISRPALAGIMKMSIRGTTKVLQRLISLKLISDNRSSPQADPRRPVFSINIDPPHDICPPELKGRRWGPVLDYINDHGGLQENQTRRLSTNRRIVRRTGRPQASIDDVSANDESAHPRTPVHVSDAEVLAVTPNPSSGSDDLAPRTPVPVTPNPSSGSPRTPVHGDPELEFTPMYIGEEKSTENRPNGLEGCAFVASDAHTPDYQDTKKNPPYSAPTPLLVGTVTKKSRVSKDVGGPMPPTPEQEKERRERRKRVRDKGIPPLNTGSDAATVKNTSSKPAMTREKAEGVLDANEAVDLTIADPDEVTEVPGTPYGLYIHFYKTVKKKWPDAQLPYRPDGKALKFGSSLLSKYSRTQLFEMIRVLVFDFENINKSRIFFKNKGPAVPIFTQLYTNDELLVTYIGSGVIEPPGIRSSAYMADFDRRHGYRPSKGSSADTGPIDEIAAERAKVFGSENA